MTHLERSPASPDREPLAPDLRELEDRAVRAWTEAMAVDPLGSGRYAVDSASGNRYVVNLDAGSCTCPDQSIRHERCKHVRRVAIQVNRGDLPPPGKARGACLVCDRETFHDEDAPALCDAHGLDRGDVVRDRETGDLAVVFRVTGERADERLIDGGTVAEYRGNEGYPDDDPVVEVVYPFSAPADVDFADLNRYAFPISRLEKQDQQLLGRWSG